MHIVKTNEKVLIWMNRNDITGSQIAAKIGITRQAWSQKMKDNIFFNERLADIETNGF